MVSENVVPVDFRLYAITNRKLSRTRRLIDIVGQALQHGVKAIQLREKDLGGRELYKLATDVNGICCEHGARLFINDRVDVMIGVNAAGVQLTEASLSKVDVTRTLAIGRLMGASTHSIDSAQRAEDGGCDFVLFGPVFDTPEKRAYGAPQGLVELERVCRAVKIPVFAVGGIDPGRAMQCRESGARGVAVISALMRSQDIAETVAEFEESLGGL